jgi:hypothetical protein
MPPAIRVTSVRKWIITCLGFAWLLHPVASIADSPLVYTVTVPADLSVLHIRTCFNNEPPQRLVSENRRAKRLIRNIHLIHDGHSQPLQQYGSDIELDEMSAGDCLGYDVQLDDRTDNSWFDARLSHRSQVLAGLQDWLWLPAYLESDRQVVEIHYHLPEGIQVSSPGHRMVDEKGEVTYRLPKRPPDWGASIALGRFTTRNLKISGAQVNIAILNARNPFNPSGFLTWIQKNIDALRLTYGVLPVHDLQVLVVPVGPDREPVPWGQLMRGGGDAVHLYIDQTRPLVDFMHDWVLMHELSHLLHPWMYARDRWLYEGIATYYQNILRAREGLITPHQAWVNLHQGFERGFNGTPVNETLVEVSENMLRNRRFMRVYWSGAAISLMADYQLRKQSHDRQSLDTALGKFDECCLPATRMWTGREFLRKLDELTESTVFIDLYNKYANATTFPELGAVYQELGLIKRGSSVGFDDQAEDVVIRKAIMQAR